jgi:integrase
MARNGNRRRGAAKRCRRKRATTNPPALPERVISEPSWPRPARPSDRAARRVTLGAVLERYRAVVSPTKRGASVEYYRLRSIARRPIARIPLRELSTADLAVYRDTRLGEVAAATVNRELILVGHAIEIARREWGVALATNPVRLLRRPRPGRGRDRRLGPGEEARLLAACRAARNRALLPVVGLALETAMRQGEIVALERARFDAARRIVALADTKNGERRVVPLSPRALAVLGALPMAGPRFFPGLTAEAVKRAFIRARNRAGLEDLRFHDLRHEAVSRLFELGLSTMEVAAITGHRTLAMLRRYTHLDAAALALKLAERAAGTGDSGPRVVRY